MNEDLHRKLEAARTGGDENVVFEAMFEAFEEYMANRRAEENSGAFQIRKSAIPTIVRAALATVVWLSITYAFLHDKFRDLNEAVGAIKAMQEMVNDHDRELYAIKLRQEMEDRYKAGGRNGR